MVGGQRLRVGDVESGGEDLAATQGTLEGIGVDNRSARRVHEDGGRLHGAQRIGVDEVARLVSQIDVQGDEVGLPQELVQLDASAPELGSSSGDAGWTSW